MKKHRKVRSTRPLTFELLESRLPLAGEVLLSTSGGSLKVTGDELDNSIEIVQDANVAGTFQVIGNNGETFKLNGVAYVSGTDIPNILKDIKVDLKKGDDSVTITGDGIGGNVTARNIDVKTGAGADFVQIQDAKVTGKVSANVGAGDTVDNDNTVEIDNVDVAKNVLVTGGKGDDHLHLSSNTVAGNVTINAKDGEDQVFVDDDNVVASTIGKNLKINTGTAIKASGGQVLGGDLVIVVGTTVTGNASITTGGGADEVQIDQSSAKKATITTGKGNDDVLIATVNDAPVTVNQVIVSLGAGDDEVLVGSGLGAAKLVLNGPAKSKVSGGAGLDTLDANGDITGAGAATAIVSAVETVNL
jgi:hypothetical protein